MRRPQFSLKSLLWLMVVIVAFLGGAAWQRQRDRKTMIPWDLVRIRFERVHPPQTGEKPVIYLDEEGYSAYCESQEREFD
jgi:hypothetical protein